MSRQVLGKKNAGKRFYNFSNFFQKIFRNFLAQVEYEWNSGVNFFFFSFSAYLIPVFAKNNAGKRFSIFLNFFAIFFGIFLPG